MRSADWIGRRGENCNLRAMESIIERFYRVKKLADQGIEPEVSAVDALEFRREQYGFTQSEFAEILAIRPSHYSEFINGKRELPKSAMRRAVAIGVPALSALTPHTKSNEE